MKLKKQKIAKLVQIKCKQNIESKVQIRSAKEEKLLSNYLMIILQLHLGLNTKQLMEK